MISAKRMAVLALSVTLGAVAQYNGDKLMTDTAGTPGAQFRQTRALIPEQR